MANTEHVEILRQGLEVWIKWRMENPDVIPYLDGANLKEADLSGTDLTEANLIKANLIQAKLISACLFGADLSGADLSGANLDGASLHGANLSGAQLRGTNLSGTHLVGANFSGANLDGADLNGAFLFTANLNGANLSNVKLSYPAEPEKDSRADFLTLASASNIESATFSPSFLEKYIPEAFNYAHDKRRVPPRINQTCISNIIDKLKFLRTFYQDKEQPQELIDVVSLIQSELIKYLKNHPNALYQIKPRKFEELIREILAGYGWETHLTPPVKDGGYDIFAISKDDTGVTTSWIIECKRYAPDNKVGVDIVRALFGVKEELKVANVLLATTSYFTKGVDAYKASRYDLELRDYEGILEWIDEYKPNPDGKLYTRNTNLKLPGKE